MRTFGDRVLGPEGPREATVRLDAAGFVDEIVDAPEAGTVDVPGLVCPAPVNAHTHLADRVARGEVAATSVEEVFAPPDGLKHRILASTDRDALVSGFREALEEAADAGVKRVLDFREGGPAGANIAREAAEASSVTVDVLGRPTNADRFEGEADDLEDLVDGLGISGLADQPSEVSEAEAAWCHERGLTLALHHSEVEREDTEAALALEPDLIVHATHCSPADIEAIADAGVPVALCPRSNALFGNHPPVGELLAAGVRLGLGTDNAMFQVPDVWAEAAYLVRDFRDVEAADALRMACGFHLPDEPPRTVAPGDRVVLLDDEGGLERAIIDRRIIVPWRDTLVEPEP